MTHTALVDEVNGKNLSLEDALGLSTTSTNAHPTTFSATISRGGISISPAPLPTNPSPGTIAIDSEDNNKFKWWTGTMWVSAGVVE